MNQRDEGYRLGQLHLLKDHVFSFRLADRGAARVPCKALRLTALDDSGQLDECTLSTDATIDGLRYAQFTSIYLSKGRVNSATLAVNTDVDGVPCAGRDHIRLDSKGRLNECTLSRDHTFDTGKLHAGSGVEVKQGKLTGGTIYEAHTFHGARCVENRGLWNGIRLSYAYGKVEGCPASQ